MIYYISSIVLTYLKYQKSSLKQYWITCHCFHIKCIISVFYGKVFYILFFKDHLGNFSFYNICIRLGINLQVDIHKQLLHLHHTEQDLQNRHIYHVYHYLHEGKQILAC